ncbi:MULTISPECIES: FixH family protein [unclassified Polaribacter]|jgi:nitrogen fixation protein FixH|uniref:FixH family protein n=1 Tax=unclassified Polaribacter TaxID=196858 RepID=UPI00052D0E25|nr:MULTISPECIES: FixH family protein [unclassified Polaribacter]KGL60808.1 cytochrome c oxidase maturation protein CcoH [Polaribacter sp. Hel1_33_49]MBT4412921.1 FixH family protein [Polaribacter sp.]MDG1195903.1 FixH family protein [Polaribacter sp.]MDG1403250.1 FixH family protein [Polaribacter sp.]PKV64901.1 nitrogen fixation protein FixH [Polaribacter sp. Hel1_33_96]
MKINWGTGIVIVIAAFISFIMYFVITMSTNNKYSYDLVTDNYYQQELQYQKQIEAEKNAKNLIENVKLKHSEFGLTVNFPKDLDYKMINGKVFLYRPSNKQLDFEIPISISKPYLLVPEKRLLDGRWNIIVSWTYEKKDYLFKKELNL